MLNQTPSLFFCNVTMSDEQTTDWLKNGEWMKKSRTKKKILKHIHIHTYNADYMNIIKACKQILVTTYFTTILSSPTPSL